MCVLHVLCCINKNRVEVWLPSFLTSVLDGAEWSASLPGRLTPGVIVQGTLWIGGWIGCGAGLDAFENRRISFPHFLGRVTFSLCSKPLCYPSCRLPVSLSTNVVRRPVKVMLNKMDSVRLTNIVSHSRNHCCSGKAVVHSVFIITVTVGYIKILSDAQQCLCGKFMSPVKVKRTQVVMWSGRFWIVTTVCSWPCFGIITRFSERGYGASNMCSDFLYNFCLKKHFSF
jgi:hypothetical protein